MAVNDSFFAKDDIGVNGPVSGSTRESRAKRVMNDPGPYRSGKHVVETFAILTADDPDTLSSDRATNDKSNAQLKGLMSYENPESILTRYKFNYYKVKGQDGNKEDSILIYNLALEDAKSLATRFKQQSFIFGKNTDDGLVFQFWANRSQSGYAYAKADEKTIFEDATEKEDYYTQISGDFKFSIPFEKFDFDDDEMMESLYSKWFSGDKYRQYFDENLTNSLSNKYTFMGRTMSRERLFSNKPVSKVRSY